MSLFSSLKPKANPSRNAFDRSRTDTFSLKLGAGTPCFVEHTVPNSHYKIDLSNICRVDSQVTANFVGFNQVVDFFYVPYSQLWHDFNKFYYGKGEETRMLSSSPRTSQPIYVPTFGFYNVVTLIIERCLDYKLYKDASDWTLSQGNVIPSGLVGWAELQEIIPDSSGTVSQRDTRFIDIHGRFCGYDQLRNLDMLGYGNYLPLLKYILPDWADTIQLMTYAQSTYQTPATPTKDNDWDTYKSYLLGEITGGIPVNESPNAWPILAYQKIFNDIYMSRIFPEQSMEEFYNVDYMTGLTVPQISTDTIVLALRPWYRMYKKDLFTGVYPNPQFGNVSVALSDSLPLLNIQAVNSNGNAFTADSVGVRFNSYLSGENSGSGTYTTSFKALERSTSDSAHLNVSALAIRQSLAFQRYKETLLRAGNREEDLQRAVFGVGSKYIEDKYVDFLGSRQSVIQMNPVAATSDLQLGSTDQHLGELGAYAVGSIEMDESQEIKYDAKDFGMIIGICYVMPDTKYEAVGIDPHLTKFEQDDYFNEDMQNLGLHPVYKHTALNVGVGNQSFSDSVLGYLAEYYEYKTTVNKVHGEFYGSNPAIPFRYDTMVGYDAARYLKIQESYHGAFSMFVAPRDCRDVAGGTKEMLYIAPWDADKVFNVQEGVEQSLDHFKMEMTFRVKAVLPMSVVGLPG